MNLKEKIRAREMAVLMVGMLLVASAVYYIMMPSHLVIGGVTGVVFVLSKFIPLSISAMTMILNVTLLIIGFIFVGNEFGIKTVITSLILPVYLKIFETVTPCPEELTDEVFVNVLCYVFILGLGEAMLFYVNASSGGLDVIAKLLNKYLHFDIGRCTIITGMAVSISSILVFDRNAMVFSVIGMYMIGKVIDGFIDGFQKRKKISIISPEYEEIQRFIVRDLDRGATLYPVKGAWRNDDRTELVTILQNSEYAKLIEKITEIDPDAFITVSAVSQVIGRWRPGRRRRTNDDVC